MATIRRRNNRYQVQIRRFGTKPLTKTFSLKADAERWARQTEVMADRGITGSEICGKTLLKELLHRYLERHAPYLKSKKQTESLVRLMIVRLGYLPVANITNPLLAQYRDKRMLEVSSQTVKHEINIVRRVIKLAAEEWGLTLTHGVPSIRMPKQTQGRERRVSDAELSSIYNYLTPTMRLAVRIALETGMRRGEIAKIKSEDLMFKRNVIVVPETKNGKPRTVPVCDQTLADLNHYLNKSEGQFNVRPDSLTQAFNRAACKSSLIDIRFHDLRHEAVTRMFESGMSVPRVSLISGHSDYRMLARYTHIQ